MQKWVKFDQKWILWLISIPEMYTFIYITVMVWKLQHLICLKKKLGSPPPHGVVKAQVYKYNEIYTIVNKPCWFCLYSFVFIQYEYFCK